MEWYRQCRLCPRNCGADRLTRDREGSSSVLDCGTSAQLDGKGICRTLLRLDSTGKLLIPAARAALHYWEEPCISGEAGSGAVFFSGCSLGCVFCQNSEISTGESGIYISLDRLHDIFLELQEKGANNINLVTAGHLLPAVTEALRQAKAEGLSIPILYNTSSYETEDQIESLSGLVDIYLPDLKYMSSTLAARYSHAPDYPEVAKHAIAHMVAQTGPCLFDEKGLIRRGTIVRHLVMPGSTTDSKAVVKYLYETYGDSIYISILNQYTPMPKAHDIPLLNRRVRSKEYEAVIDYALSIGVTNGFRQEGTAVGESFIPPFDHTGIL